MDERARFVFEAERSDLPFAELCRRYGISRPTGYKWVDRPSIHPKQRASATDSGHVMLGRPDALL
jgi:transposase-like protein